MRGMGACGEQDAAVLEQVAGALPLGTADDLVSLQEKVAGRLVLEAQECAAASLLATAAERGFDVEGCQGGADEVVHAAEPARTVLPRRAGRQGDGVGQLVVVDDGAAAAGPADVGQGGEAVDRGLEVAEAERGRLPSVEAESGAAGGG